MRIARSRQELAEMRGAIDIFPVGFVPTMGALHQGHISLVESAVQDCPVVIVSIFVNPTQFNDAADLKNYPRTVDADILLLSAVMREEDILFLPSEKDIYPEKSEVSFNFGNLDKVMEGKYREGHFNGVAQVVSILFNITRADVAYFGKKDFQQLAIIRALVKKEDRGITIIGCPIIREEDGLAMSSRNALLEPKIRKDAGIIRKTMLEAAKMAGEKEILEICKYVSSVIDRTPGFNTQYFEVVEDETLQPVKFNAEISPLKSYHACIAVFAGKIRLIDNIRFNLY